MSFLSSLEWKLYDPMIFILSIIFSWLFAHRIYNRYFHTLRNVPGPFFGRMSPWPSTLHAFRGDRHLWLQHCFDKYGNKIRVEPNTVLFRSPTASQDIYGSKANVMRAPFYDALKRKDEEANTITTIDNTLHAKKRKMLNLAFTEKSLRGAAAFMAQHIDRWNTLLISNADGKNWSAPINFTPRVDALVFDILGDICFGRSFEIKEPGENLIRDVPHAIIKMMKFVYTIAKSPFLPVIPFLRPRGLSRLLDSARSKEIVIYDNFMETSVKDRLQRQRSDQGPSRQDMIHFLANAVDPDTGRAAFTDREIQAEASLLVVAGSDSTSVSLCGLFYYLAHYPRVNAKLVEEITSMFGTADDIGPGPKLSSCEYTRACIDEAMRLAPAGLSELPRQVLPGGITIDGDFFPPGTVVGTANWTDGRNKEVYGDAEIFRPERWIPSEDNPAEDVSRIKAAFHPFSMGLFNCAGTKFALQELMLIVAKTVHRLEFRMAPSYESKEAVPCFPLIDAYITVRDGPVLQFRQRG